MLGKLAGAVVLVAGVAVVRAHVAAMLIKEPDIQKWEPTMAKEMAPLAFEAVRTDPKLHLGLALRAIVSGVAHGIQETIEFGLPKKNTGV
jgi:hypothetical protein